MARSISYSLVDAFTSTPFKGNAAAVIVLDSHAGPPLQSATLQLIAAELNQSETAFLRPIDEGRFGLRWFTPEMEFPLCGHATLASASVLFSCTYLPDTVNEISFETLSGVLTAKLNPDRRIELQFPAGKVTAVDDTLDKTVRNAVLNAFHPHAEDLNVVFIGVGHGISFGKYMVIHVEETDLENATVDTAPFRILAPQYETIIITQNGRSSSETFVSRVFCPVESILEDPVTGSAHCMLGPYWATRLRIQDATEMLGRQVSARSGEVGVVWNREKGTCLLRGHATLVAHGEVLLPVPAGMNTTQI